MAIYGVATELFPDQKLQDALDKDFLLKDQLIAHFNEHLSGLDNASKSEYFSLDIKYYDLSIESIKKESPFEIIFVGLALPLVIAVILSGGEIKIPFTKVKLNPIGYGIKMLREALQVQPEFGSVNMTNV